MKAQDLVDLVTRDAGDMEGAIKRACDIIEQYAPDASSGFGVGHSGGKDSDVVHHLTNIMLAKDFPVGHTSKFEGFNKILPETLDYIYSRPFTITFYPEGTIFPYAGQIDGTRAAEAERHGKSTDLVVNGESINRAGMGPYNPCGLFQMQFVYPIYDWSDEMVWAYHIMYDMPFSAEYKVEAAIVAEAKALLAELETA
jgi:3'-phosphoadenosine 5'-phosphosulfate sulfotransferase (PAPS reductase)/FAD synthetase